MSKIEQHVWKTNRALRLERYDQKIPDYEGQNIVIFKTEFDVRADWGEKIISEFYRNELFFRENPIFEFLSPQGFVIRVQLISVECEENVFREFPQNTDAGYLADRFIFLIGLTQEQVLSFDQNNLSFDY